MPIETVHLIGTMPKGLSDSLRKLGLEVVESSYLDRQTCVIEDLLLIFIDDTYSKQALVGIEYRLGLFKQRGVIVWIIDQRVNRDNGKSINAHRHFFYSKLDADNSQCSKIVQKVIGLRAQSEEKKRKAKKNSSIKI